MFSLELKYGFQIVSELERSRQEGRSVTIFDLRRMCGNEVPIFNNVIFRLIRSGWVSTSDYPSLSVDLGGKSLFDLAEAVGDSAADEHGYVYGWSSGSLVGAGVAIDLSRQLSDEYRERLRGIRLAVLVGDPMNKVNNTERKRVSKRNLRDVYLKQGSGI